MTERSYDGGGSHKYYFLTTTDKTAKFHCRITLPTSRTGKNWRCSICDEVFAFRSKYDRHLKTTRHRTVEAAVAAATATANILVTSPVTGYHDPSEGQCGSADFLPKSDQTTTDVDVQVNLN